MSRVGHVRSKHHSSHDTADTQHSRYLKLTSTNAMRQKKQLERSHGPRGERGDPELLQTLVQTSKSEGGSLAATEARKERNRKAAARKSADDAHADDVVLKRMDARLHFLRNPRYDPECFNHRRKLTARPPSPPLIGRETYKDTDPAALAMLAETEKALALRTDPKDVPIVTAEPSSVLFANHRPGEQYPSCAETISRPGFLGARRAVAESMQL